MIHFEVAGRPQTKKRIAVGCKNNTYNPSKPIEQEFAAVVVDQCNKNLVSLPRFSPSECLHVDVKFLFPPKQSCKGNQLLQEADVDNLCKFVLDALNKVLYADNRQIIGLTARKALDEPDSSGRIVVEVSKLAVE